MSKFLRVVDRKLSKLSEGSSESEDSEDNAHDLAHVVQRIYSDGQMILTVGKHLLTVAQHYHAHDNPEVLKRAQEIVNYTSTAAHLCTELNGQLEKFRGSDSSGSSEESSS